MNKLLPHLSRVIPSLVLGAFLGTATPWAHAGDLKLSVTNASGKALPDAVVYLISTNPTTKALVKPRVGAEIAQIGKQFLPRVSVVPVGSAVSFPNKDTVRHHVYSFSPAKVFDLKLYAGTPPTPVVFEAAGVVVLGCNIHDKMAAWLVVVDTPYYAKTEADGTATLAAIPAGNYTLRAWHPDLPVGSAPQDLAVTASEQGASLVVVLKNLAP